MRLMGTGADVEWWHSMDIICQHEDSARTMSVRANNAGCKVACKHAQGVGLKCALPANGSQPERYRLSPDASGQQLAIMLPCSPIAAHICRLMLSRR
eukprot:scaffold117895_cov29-Tisochrysis_lutea.AAC.2